MLPAAGQGALGIEVRAGRADLLAALAPLADAHAWLTTAAERAVSRAMGGSCSMPLAAHATLEAGQMHLRAAWGEDLPVLRIEELALRLKQPSDGTRLVTGSLFMLGDLLREMGVFPQT